MVFHYLPFLNVVIWRIFLEILQFENNSSNWFGSYGFYNIQTFATNINNPFQTFSPTVQHFTNFFDIQTLRKYLATIDGFLQKIPFFASKTLAKNALCLQFSGVMCLRDAIISALVKKKTSCERRRGAKEDRTSVWSSSATCSTCNARMILVSPDLP